MPPIRIERTTRGLGNRCSIQLSYGGVTVVSMVCDSLSTPIVPSIPVPPPATIKYSLLFVLQACRDACRHSP